MWILANYYWNLCTFRKGPEHAPSYPVFLLAVSTLFFLFNVVTQVLFEERSFSESIAITICVIFFLFSTLLGLLYLKGVPRRFIATAGALLGQDLFIEVIFLPLRYFLPLDEGDTGFFWSLLLMIYLLSLCWDLAVKGHILQRALNVGPVLGMALAVTLVISTILFAHYVNIFSQIVVS